MKATQEMYDAAQAAYEEPGCDRAAIDAAVDAVLALVPVVEVDEALADRLNESYWEQPAQRGGGMLVALQETLPASFVVGGELERITKERDTARACFDCHDAALKDTIARAEAAEKLAEGLKRGQLDCQSALASAEIDLDTARAELAALREAHDLLVQDYAGAAADRKALSGELAALRAGVAAILRDYTSDAIDSGQAVGRLRSLQLLTPEAPRAQAPAAVATDVCVSYDAATGEHAVYVGGERYVRPVQGQGVALVTREQLIAEFKRVHECVGSASGRFHGALADAAARALGVTLADAPVSVPASAPCGSEADDEAHYRRRQAERAAAASAPSLSAARIRELEGDGVEVAAGMRGGPDGYWERRTYALRAGRMVEVARSSSDVPAPAVDAATTGERPVCARCDGLGWYWLPNDDTRYTCVAEDCTYVEPKASSAVAVRPDSANATHDAPPASDGLAERVARLESQVQQLRDTVYELAKTVAGGGQ